MPWIITDSASIMLRCHLFLGDNALKIPTTLYKGKLCLMDNLTQILFAFFTREFQGSSTHYGKCMSSFFDKYDRETRKWTCLKCGQVMGYEYMIEGGFDENGCPNCDSAAAIEQIEAKTDG